MVLFPLQIFYLLGLLDTSVLGPLVQDFACGEDVTLEDCAAKGPDLACTRNAFKTTFAVAPELWMGSIA